jgi:hypothetical protein
MRLHHDIFTSLRPCKIGDNRAKFVKFVRTVSLRKESDWDNFRKIEKIKL